MAQKRTALNTYSSDVYRISNSDYNTTIIFNNMGTVIETISLDGHGCGNHVENTLVK
jgi:hypothetical protein